MAFLILGGAALFLQVQPLQMEPLVVLCPVGTWSAEQDATVSYVTAPEFTSSAWDWIGLYSVSGVGVGGGLGWCSGPALLCSPGTRALPEHPGCPEAPFPGQREALFPASSAGTRSCKRGASRPPPRSEQRPLLGKTLFPCLRPPSDGQQLILPAQRTMGSGGGEKGPLRGPVWPWVFPPG